MLAHSANYSTESESQKQRGKIAKGGGNGFQVLGLSEPVYRGIVRMGFRMPTPVQRKALPVILSGVDSVVMARTGSGKTCAFLIPVLEKLLATQQPQASSLLTSGSTPTLARGMQHGCRVVILSPTRELSLQTLQVLRRLSHFLPDLKCVGIHGGEGMEKQFDVLAGKPDVICATPGRLAHHLTEIPDFSLQSCVMCVLDEADRLFELGLAAQIRQISTHLPAPERCQKVLLSATMPKVLVEFTKTGFFGHVDPPHVIRLDQECQVSPDLRLAFITCRSSEKDAALLHLLSNISSSGLAAKTSKNTQQQDNRGGDGDDFKGLILIFAATRHHVEYITALLTASHFSCTMIYGTLDHEARQQNLHEFKSGRKTILVVTDVAARGIDVPLIDHVVHYQFPPSPKLFVHRSGRAARGLGRRGYGWALVEPDEMPYMMDLHLFLGRPVRTGPLSKAKGSSSQSTSEKSSDPPLTTTTDSTTTMDSDTSNRNHPDGAGSFPTYTLDEMTPDMVHYGSVPEAILTLEVENVQRILDSELTGSQQAETLRSLVKVCTNAMKQYRRTRPDPSREGIRRAKAILEGELNGETGERTGGGAIPAHPLLRHWEMKYYHQLQDKQKEVGGGLNDLENLRKRQDFLQAMSSFRPKETVFEAFGTGGGKDVGVLSQVDKGRTTTQTASSTASRAALLAMKNMRRQMKLARSKSSALVVAGSATALEANGETASAPVDGETPIVDATNTATSEKDESLGKADDDKNEALLALLTAPADASSLKDKQRISKAQRRRIKKDPGAADQTSTLPSVQPKKKIMRGADFRDPSFFIEQDITSNWEEVQQARQREAALQPSGAGKNGAMSTALRIEEAMMDVMGDESAQLVQRQRMMRWDKSKRKYVATTVGAELSGDSKTKKMRLESGQLVKSGSLKLGDLYEKWQKKTNRSIGRTGVFDDVTEDADSGDVGRRKGKRNGKSNATSINKGSVDKVKTSTSIKKEREMKQNMKLKNMKREDRRRLEKRKRTERNEKMRPKPGKQPPKKVTKKRKV